MKPPWDGLQTWMVDWESNIYSWLKLSPPSLTIGENYRKKGGKILVFNPPKNHEKRLFFWRQKNR